MYNTSYMTPVYLRSNPSSDDFISNFPKKKFTEDTAINFTADLSNTAREQDNLLDGLSKTYKLNMVKKIERCIFSEQYKVIFEYR